MKQVALAIFLSLSCVFIAMAATTQPISSPSSNLIHGLGMSGDESGPFSQIDGVLLSAVQQDDVVGGYFPADDRNDNGDSAANTYRNGYSARVERTYPPVRSQNESMKGLVDSLMDLPKDAYGAAKEYLIKPAVHRLIDLFW